MKRLVNKLRTLFFDYFIIEGSSCFFKISLVLFELLSDRLKYAIDKTDFAALMTVYIKKVKNIEKFRELIQDTYINKHIIERVRSKLTKQMIQKHKTDFQRLNCFNCDDFEDFCFTNITFIPKKETHQPAFIIKGDELLDNLKFNFYRPFFEFKLKKKVTKLTLPIETIEKINNLIEQNNSETSVMESDTYEEEELEEIQSATFNKNKRKTSFANILKMIKNDEDIGQYKLDFKKREKGQVLSYVKKNKDIDEINTDPNESFFKAKIDILLFKPNDVLCVRNRHTCYLKKIEREREVLRKERKRKFFKKSNKKLFIYLGEIIKNIILFKESRSHISDSENSKLLPIQRFKPIYRLKRTSFELTKPKKFYSLEVSRNNDFIQENGDNNVLDQYYLMEDKKLRKSFDRSNIASNELDLLAIDNFFDTFDKQYKFGVETIKTPKQGN